MTVVLRTLPWLLAALLFAALVHFVAVLILPRVATRDAFDRLKPLASAHGVTLLPPTRPDDALIPFRDPAVVQGVCFYDLTKSPYRVRVHVEAGRLVTLAFRTHEGRIFYSITDRAALHDTLDIHLLTDDQLQEVEAADDEDQGLPEELRLKAPEAKGLMVATALVARPSERADAQQSVKAITCEPEPMPAPE